MIGRVSEKSASRSPAGAKRVAVALPLCFVVCLTLLTGCDLPGRPDPADRPAPADQVMDFTVLFGRNCAGCHGADGELGPAPPLKDALFRAIVPEEELKNVITKGRDKTLMPAFAKENGGALTAAQIEVLVKEIKGVPYQLVKNPAGGIVKIEAAVEGIGITPKWGTPAKPPGQMPSYRATAGAAGNKEKGAKAFARACASCHGSDGEGMDKVGAVNDRVFLALLSDQALRRYIITGRPDLKMPGFAERPDRWHFEPLTDAEVADLVALLASWRGEK